MSLLFINSNADFICFVNVPYDTLGFKLLEGLLCAMMTAWAMHCKDKHTRSRTAVMGEWLHQVFKIGVQFDYI